MSNAKTLHLQFADGEIEVGTLIDALYEQERTIAILRQHKTDYMEAAEGTRKALEAKNAALAGANDNLKITISELVDECDQLKAELAAIKRQEPDCDRSACGDFSPGRCDNPDCSARRDRKPALPAAPEGGQV